MEWTRGVRAPRKPLRGLAPFPRLGGVRPRALVVGAFVTGATVAAWLHVRGPMTASLGTPDSYVALQTAISLMLFLSAAIVLGRRRGIDHLALAAGLLTIALSRLFFVVVSLSAEPAGGSSGRTVWTSTVAGSLGAALLAVGPLLPRYRLRRPHLARRLAVLAVFVVLGGVATLARSVPERLLDVTNPWAPNTRSLDPPTGEPFLVAMLLFTSLCFVIAAFGFAAMAERDDDEMMTWFAVGAALASISSAGYAVNVVSTDASNGGDAIRLVIAVVLFLGIIRELRRISWRAAEHAVLEERRRIAHDLHDGIAQELAFVVRRARRLRDDGDLVGAQEIVSAAERALEESRLTLAALTGRSDQPLDVVLTDSLRWVAAREDARLELDLQSAIDVAAPVREGLVMIACEAVSNAARHSGADAVSVSLSNGHGVTLRVEDDGRGFDPGLLATPTASRGYGLISMRERAEALGGRFTLTSSPGVGTCVEVHVG